MPLKASVAADWITRKVIMSIEAQEGYIFCAITAMYLAMYLAL